MPRTFSLRWLLVGITLFCILCAGAVNFPRPFLYCLLFVEKAFAASTYLFPAVVTWAIFVTRTPHRLRLSLNSVAGVLTCWVLIPFEIFRTQYTYDPLIDYFIVSVPLAIMTCLFGLINTWEDARRISPPRS